MRDASGERPLSLLADTTVGLRQSGIIAIDISPDEQDRSGSWFQLILRPRASGLHWPPRLVRLAANVLAVEQAEAVTDLQQGTGLPGQNMRFSRTGRMTDRPLTVTSAEGAASGIGWEARPKLDDSGPADRHYVLDTQRNRILFGNGINGLAPPADAALTVDYEVCTGVAGNIARGMEWSVRGVAGTFGVNAEPFSGASDGIDIDGLQAAARSSLSQRKVHVTSGDLEAAALALDWLNVARAHELPPLPCTPRGLRSLLVVAEAAETDTVAETPTWLAAIRSELAPGLPLGEHLRLIAPRSIGLRIRARLTVAETATAEKVDEAVAKLLRSKFMAPAPQTHSVWPFGRDVAALTVKGWLRGIKNVVRVADLQLLGDGVPAKGDLALGAIELPRWENVPGDIVVERQRGGGWL
jgi:predicted phage baseplate assembly protein